MDRVKKILFFTLFFVFASNFNMDKQNSSKKPISFHSDYIKLIAKKTKFDINEIQKIINRKKRTFSLKIPLILNILGYGNLFYYISKKSFADQYAGIFIAKKLINNEFEHREIRSTNEDFFLPFREYFKIDALQHEVGIAKDFDPEDSLLSLVEKSQIENILFLHIPVEWIKNAKDPLLAKKIDEYIKAGGMELPTRIILFRTGSSFGSFWKKSFFDTEQRNTNYIEMQDIEKVVEKYANLTISKEIDIKNILFHTMNEERKLRLRINEEIGDTMLKIIDNFIQQSQWFEIKTKRYFSFSILREWKNDFYFNNNLDTIYFPYGVEQAGIDSNCPTGSSIAHIENNNDKEFIENIMAQIQKKAALIFILLKIV